MCVSERALCKPPACWCAHGACVVSSSLLHLGNSLFKRIVVVLSSVATRTEGLLWDENNDFNQRAISGLSPSWLLDLLDVGPLGCWTSWLLDHLDVGPLGCWTSWMLDLLAVGPLGCWTSWMLDLLAEHGRHCSLYTVFTNVVKLRLSRSEQKRPGCSNPCKARLPPRKVKY